MMPSQPIFYVTRELGYSGLWTPRAFKEAACRARSSIRPSGPGAWGPRHFQRPENVFYFKIREERSERNPACVCVVITLTQPCLRQRREPAKVSPVAQSRAVREGVAGSHTPPGVATISHDSRLPGGCGSPVPWLEQPAVSADTAETPPTLLWGSRSQSPCRRGWERAPGSQGDQAQEGPPSLRPSTGLSEGRGGKP